MHYTHLYCPPSLLQADLVTCLNASTHLKLAIDKPREQILRSPVCLHEIRKTRGTRKGKKQH